MRQLTIVNDDKYLWWDKVRWECPDDLDLEETIEMVKGILRHLGWTEEQIGNMISERKEG